jgi:hypothetical protein
VLESLDINIDEVRMQVARIVGQGDEIATGQIPFTPRAKKVLELALREALSLGHNYIGTEHVLLGLARENEGVAARILLDFDADADTIRNEVIRSLSGVARSPGEPFTPKSPPIAPEVVDEIEKVRREREEAIEQKEFERAAQLRDRERRLVRAARELESAWSYEPLPGGFAHASMSHEFRGEHGRVLFPALPSLRTPRRVFDYGPTTGSHLALLLGWALFGVALGIGILIGWAIWG